MLLSKATGNSWAYADLSKAKQDMISLRAEGEEGARKIRLCFDFRRQAWCTAGASQHSIREDGTAVSHQQWVTGLVQGSLAACPLCTPQLGFGGSAEGPAPAYSKSNSWLLRAGL